MKRFTLALTMGLLVGMVTNGFAGNKPAVTYPVAAMAPAGAPLQVVVTNPWNKNILHYYSTGVISRGCWYTHCPVKTSVVLNSKYDSEVTLSNGKRITLSYAGLKDAVEANLAKYEPYMH
jgi:hypothetical protein